MRQGLQLHQRFEFPAEVESVASTLTQLNSLFDAANMPCDDRFQLQLCLAELLNNIVEHAYHSQTGGNIRLSLRLSPNLYVARLRDTGQRFRHSPESASLWNEHGRGLVILEAWSDRLRRQRRNGMNCTLLIKRRSH